MFDLDWRVIPGWPGYLACSDGSIWSSRRGDWVPLSASVASNGYRSVRLYRGRERSAGMPVHQIIAIAFHGDRRPERLEVRHLDCNPLNNRPSNLCWGTSAENKGDSVRLARNFCPRGAANPKARLTATLVAEIRAASTGAFNEAAILAERYGISRSAIYHLLSGRTWKVAA